MLTSSRRSLVVILVIIVFILVLTAMLLTLVIAAILLVWIVGVRIVISPGSWLAQLCDSRGAERRTIHRSIHRRLVDAVPVRDVGRHTHRCCRSMAVRDHLGSRNRCFLVDAGRSLHHSGLDRPGPEAAGDVPT